MVTDVMPAGSMPPEVIEETREEVAQEPILGKFKSADDLATAYKELERKIGEQGNELGATKSMNQMLMEQINQRQAQAQVPASEAEKDIFDYESQMASVRAAVESGDISIEDAMMQVGNLASESATRRAVSKYQEMTEAQKTEAAKEKFLTDNSDFFELQKTGQLEPIKKALPGMHDDFSAYYAFKAQQATAQAQQEQENRRIAQGDERTTKVLQKPGNPSQQPGKPTRKLSPSELKAKTLADLEAMG